MTTWSWTYEGYDPDEVGLREALCTVGNGYVATRGAAPESWADGVHYPGTYAAGIYNRLTSEVAGREVENESLVNLPNWLPLTFRVEGGPWFHIDEVEVLEQRETLDLRCAVLTRHVRFRDAAGRTTTLNQRRFAAMDKPHVLALETTLLAEDWSGAVEVRSLVDADVENSLVERYRALGGDHLELQGACELSGDSVMVEVATNRSHIRVGMAARTTVADGDGPLVVARSLVRDGGRIGHVLALEVERGRSVTVDKGRHRLHQPGHRHRRAGHHRGPVAVAAPRHRRPAPRPRPRLAGPVGAVPHGPGRRRARPADPAAPPRPPPPDGVAQHRRPRRGRPAARAARRGVPGPHLLGRGVRPAGAHPAPPGPHPWAAALPLPPARRGPGRSPGRRLRGGDVPVAVGQRRAGGEPGAAPQPGVGALAARPDAPPAPRRPGRGLQRLALPPGHRRRRVPLRPRRRGADRDRPVLGQHRHLRPRPGPVRDPGRHGARRVPLRLPGRAGGGHRQQRVHERHGRVGPAPHARGARPAARRPTGRAARPAAGHLRRAGPLGGRRAQDVRALPRRDHQPVRGLRGPRGARLGRLPRALRRHPPARPASSRARTTRSTGTRRSSRPTWSCSSTCSPPKS